MITPLITGRDREILAYLVRHGVGTPDQIGRKFFTSQWACYRRLRKLEAIRLVVRRRTWWQGPHVLIPTGVGSALAQVDLSPVRKLVMATLEHDLAVVDLSELLLSSNAGSKWLTERELRRDVARQLRVTGMGREQVMRPRYPDGVLILSDGQQVAVELDLTGKSTSVYQGILSAYAAKSGIAAVWWFSPSEAVLGRISGLVRQSAMEDFFKVYQWSPQTISGNAGRSDREVMSG